MKLIKLLTLIVAGLIFITTSSAVNAGTIDNLTIRLEQPKSPTSLSDFYVTFVALDINDRPITVTCQKQFEGGAVTSFDSTKNLSAGGNTDTCHVNSAVFDQKGSYTLSVQATAGSDSASDSVVVEYNNETPGDPKDYSKDKISGCTYEIKFRSADDGGKTSKIEVYRSTETYFTADSSTRVAEEIMGSDTSRTITNNIPECNQTYYYAVRAFSASGKGSGIVGDKEVKIVDSTSATATPTLQTAIPVEGSGGSILGTTEEAGVGTTAETGRVLGVEGDLPEDATATAQSTTTSPNILRAIAIAIAIFLLIGIIRRRSA